MPRDALMSLLPATVPLTPAQRRPCQTSLMLHPAAALRPHRSPTSTRTTPTTTTSTAVAIRNQSHKGSRAARMGDDRQRGGTRRGLQEEYLSVCNCACPPPEAPRPPPAHLYVEARKTSPLSFTRSKFLLRGWRLKVHLML